MKRTSCHAKPPEQGKLHTNTAIRRSRKRVSSVFAGVIVLLGTANVENFGFYKYEVARPGDTLWQTIQAGRNIIQDSELGQWDTRTMAPGDYMLRLVIVDNQGESLEPCVIRVNVNNPSEP